MHGQSKVASLMAKWQDGDNLAGNDLFRNVQDELNQIARAKLAREFRSSLSTGDLINEAVIRLSRLKDISIESREHVLALASRIMKQVLIDQARKRNADKRYHTKVTLVTGLEEAEDSFDLLSVNLVLDELRAIDPERADIVEMRYFGGLTIEETANVMKIAVNTVKRDWNFSKTWLLRELSNN